MSDSEIKEINTIKELADAMNSIPDLQGTVTVEEDHITWLLPNGISLEFYLNEWYSKKMDKKFGEWYVGATYAVDGKEREITHWHPSTDEVLEDVLAFHTGETFWVVRKKLFGGEWPPETMDKGIYDRIKNKKNLRIL